MKTPKTQIFDCIYCQLEGTIEELRRHEDLRFSIGMEKVREDLRRALRSIDPKRLDHLIFSGMGEPTLNLELGDLIDRGRNRSAMCLSPC